MTTHTATEAAEIIASVPGTRGVNVWEKAGHSRVYFDTPKLNGGLRWNGGKGCRGLYYDAKTGKIVEGEWAGAKTATRGDEIIERVEAALAAGQAES